MEVQSCRVITVCCEPVREQLMEIDTVDDFYYFFPPSDIICYYLLCE